MRPNKLDRLSTEKLFKLSVLFAGKNSLKNSRLLCFGKSLQRHDTWHNGIHHNDTLDNDTLVKVLVCDTQHKGLV